MLKNIEIASSILIAIILIVFLVYQFYLGHLIFGIVGLIMLAFNIYYLLKEMIEKKEDK